MTTFYLVRHGAKQYAVEDKLLSNVGEKQADLTGKYLENKGIGAIYVSPLRRTLQTAEIINEHLNLPVITDKRLRERMNFGDVANQSFEDFLAEWIKTSKDRNYTPIAGDSSYNTGQRVKAVLDEINVEGTVLVVTHGGAIGDFLQNTFPKEQLSFSPDALTHGEYIEILECSITEVVKTNGSYTLKRVNDTSHLPVPVL